MVTITTRMSVAKLPSRYAMRIYFHEEGETILEDFFRRRSRPHRWYETLLPAVIQEARLGFNLAGDLYQHDAKDVRWSQRAGCSCGCSPGFRVNVFVGYDLYVTFSTSVIFTDDPPPQE